MEENLCLSCGKPNPDSLKIFEAYLCADCEAKLLESDVGKNDYPHWIESCRKLWEKISTKVSSDASEGE